MDEELRSSFMRPETFDFQIPVEVLQQFKTDIRIIIKYPGLIGIPIPDVLLNRDILANVRDMEPMLVPRQMLR